MGVRDLSEEQILAKHNALDHGHQLRAKVLDRVHRVGEPPTVDPEAIAVRIACDYHVTVCDLKGPRRHKTIATARKALYAALRATGMSFPEIGRFVGGRDHTTVIYGVRSFEEQVRRRQEEEAQS